MSVTRRRRRERQIIVFGVLIIVIVAIGVAAAAVFRGDAEGPLSAGFTTPVGEFESDVTLVCPPDGAMPLSYDQVVVRVDNGTDISGLAGTTAGQLESRGFTVVGTTNWSRSYDDYVQILFGADGVQQAYTLATQFEASTDAAVELVLDNRDGITLDLVLGTQFSEAPNLRDALAPELDMELPLTAGAECLPVNLVEPRPAPNVLPENPLAEASPSPSAEGEGE
ncbi:LytR C-terminal domain-containing protein [Demequina sp. NBRC 110057]|uniref:LytR C-terminal domain-containing protein n=1 Tax=Demequina sp. NBRC 110057 TaxID=1570346 RepID=UPI0011785891|nr:LytR C-terminal domain-containing protein [Demequina sp. NBRC 110057]